MAHRTRKAELTIRAAFGVALALLIVIGFASFHSVAQLSQNSALVARSHRVISTLDEIVHRAAEAESAQRGFVITGDESFVSSFDQIVDDIDVLRERLRSSLQPAQGAQFGKLQEALDARIARSNQVIALSRQGGVASVQEDIRQHGTRGTALQARLRSIADEIEAAEQAVLDDRERMTARSTALSKNVILGGSLFALIFVVLSLFAIRRNFAGRERAEADLTRFFDLSIDLFVITGGDGYFKRVSPAIADMLGYTEDEILRIPYMDLVHPDDHARATNAVKRQIQTGERIDAFIGRMRHKDGSYRVLSWRSMPRGSLMFGTARDVTEEMRASQELREAKAQLEERVTERTSALEEANESLRLSERRFRALIENGSDSIALIDAHNKILYLSPAVTNVEGYRPDELLGRLGTEHTHPDDMPTLANAMQQLLAHPGKPIPATWRRRHKDGHWIWLEGIATNLLNDPSVGAIVCNYRDITERLAHERRLNEQLRRLALLSRVTRAIGERQDLRSIFQVVVRTLEDDLPVDFCLICLHEDTDHRLSVSCIGAKSEQPAAGVGLQKDTLLPIDENGLGRCVRGQLVYEADIASSTFDFPRRLAQAGMSSLVIAPLVVESHVFGVLVCARREAQAFGSAECEFLRQASEHIALASNQASLYSALQQAYDDLRQSQQQVMQQERLRALGQMASGIAHDINNAISPVSLYTEALLEREQLSPRARGHLEIIQRAVDDVAQTVQRMGEFYRQREPQLHLIPVELNKLVRQVIDLTRARWSDMAQQRGANIEMRPELEPGLPQIAAVESQIRDALVNLVFNAVDAMPQGGALIVRTFSGPGSGWTRLVHLEVSDQGVGMDEQTRRRCLEPFFTTKGERGTGLGLPMVYGVVQRHGASLEIDSTPGKGTTVRLSFPAGTAEDADRAADEASDLGPQRILIIDDDPLLLKSLRDTLEAEGHEVVSASGGQAGINAFVEAHAEGHPFPVVITDLGMPHVDGRKVASAIKGSVPRTVILMLTGWGRRLVAEGDIPPGVDEILSKPPKITELRAALVAHLGSGSGR